LKKEQGADRGTPVRNRIGCKQRDTSGEENRVQTEGPQLGIEQDADRGAPVGNITGCIQRGEE
jgi:hypothetical protein